MFHISLRHLGKDLHDFNLEPGQDLVVGRSEDCELTLDDRSISRKHLVLRNRSGRIEVEGMNPLVPLSINGIETNASEIHVGDVIKLGAYELVFENAKQASEAVESYESGVDGLAPMADDILKQPEQVRIGVDDQENALSEELKASPINSISENLNIENEVNAQNNAESSESSESLNLSDPGQSPQTDGGTVILSSEGQDGTNLNSSTRVISAQDSKVKVRLKFKDSSAELTEYVIDKNEISIGRGKSVDVTLKDPKISRRHAVIKRNGLRFTLCDLGGTNGTSLNGEKITEAPLASGDIIKIGQAEFEFEAVSMDYEEKAQNFLQVVSDPEPSGMIDGGFAGQSQQPAISGSSSVGAPGSPMFGAELNPAIIGTGIGTSDPQTFGAAGISGVAVPRKPGIMGFVQSLPPRKRMLYGIVAVLLVWVLMEDEPTKTKVKKGPKPAAQSSPSVKGGPITFDMLSAEQKRFVEGQHQLAFDFYKNRDYDKALFEIRKIFQLITDYKDAREIERYALEGKKKLEAMQEEKRKKDEEERARARVTELVVKASELMNQKKYAEVEPVFSEIVMLDPENKQVVEWRGTIKRIEEEKQMKEQEKRVQIEINRRAWEVFNEGTVLQKEGKYYEAIDTFEKVKSVEPSDKKVIVQAAQKVQETIKMIDDIRNPILEKAKMAEQAGELGTAFQEYEKATKVDQKHSEGYEGMNRIRGVLHDRAKKLYAEAVIAESYSDYVSAKKKYDEILVFVPKDDIYFERATARLKRQVAFDLSGQSAELAAKKPGDQSRGIASKPGQTIDSAPSVPQSMDSAPGTPTYSNPQETGTR